MNPYKMVLVDGKYHPEHRVIMEEHLGRKLARNEVVHHINEDKHDNRIENLMVMKLGDHTEMHHRKYPRKYICPICGREYERLSTRYGKVVTCSKKCMGEWFKKNSTSKKKVNQYALNGRYIRQWDSVTDIALAFNVSDGSIVQCCKKAVKKSHWYIWRYADEYAQNDLPEEEWM